MSNENNNHEAFVIDEILPAVVRHAHGVDVSVDEVATHVMLGMISILQARGHAADELIAAIETSLLPTHNAPEGLQ